MFNYNQFYNTSTITDQIEGHNREIVQSINDQYLDLIKE